MSSNSCKQLQMANVLQAICTDRFPGCKFFTSAYFPEILTNTFSSNQSNNISAAQIHQDYQRRVREAEQEAAQEVETQRADFAAYEEEQHANETPEERKKRKRRETTTLAKIKQSKEFSRRKARRIDGLDDEDEDDDALARDMMDEQSRPMPGQLENCEVCSKRFTVTSYSKAGSSGGLLCPKCSKEAADDEKKSKPNKKRGPRTGRRQLQSNLLDGIIQYGAMSLVEMCTKVCGHTLALT